MSWRAHVSRNLRELRICLSAKQSCLGVQNFVKNNYFELKMLNPKFPFLVREGADIDPYFIAEYDWGKSETVDLTDLSEEEVVEKLKALVEKGKTLPRAPVEPIPFPIVDASLWMKSL
mmetsp:Transcript_30284/g.39944  ORF Transcript_30284/g.39944 Transcript_30284/m.39944 type:complete len:118 (-) Transcript_30284:166-519(-)